MTKNNQDIRWIQRFSNYKKAFTLLREIVEERDLNTLSNLEKEGVVKRFELSLELAWKTLKDKMQDDGIVFDKVAPKPVLKQAYQSQYIKDIDVWLNMINDRNLMSHTYNFDDFNKIIATIKDEYYQALKALFDYFIEAQLD